MVIQGTWSAGVSCWLSIERDTSHCQRSVAPQIIPLQTDSAQITRRWMNRPSVANWIDAKELTLNCFATKTGFSFMTLLSSIIITSLIRNLLGTRSNISFTLTAGQSGRYLFHLPQDISAHVIGLSAGTNIDVNLLFTSSLTTPGF